MKPSIEVLGVYRLTITIDLVREMTNARFVEPENWPGEKKAAEQAGLRELREAVLVEVLVLHRDDQFRIEDFGQPQSDQAAYAERYLSDDGESVVGTAWDPPSGPTLRLAFFLHYLHVDRPLLTSYGPVTLPEPRPMPLRLSRLMPYQPVA
ncbi:MAG: hypothetical protein IPJ17_12145 [Holophagales bacterium]|nr:MAG: hypothetical protein IPJ17_12145 [Holophagales bacterium]